MLTVGSLFSGIGGIDLGLERAGFTVRWQAEVNEYASEVLAKHWPDVPNLGDVTTIDWENDGLDYGDGIARSLHVDLLAGGFPCQPVSLAGQRRGQDDERWLWPEYARAVRDLRPGHVLVENVPGLLVRGMGDVLGDLATLGYDAEWECIPAAAVGAPHLRWRIFVVAHAHDQRQLQPAGCQSEERNGVGVSSPDVAYAPSSGLAGDGQGLPRPGGRHVGDPEGVPVRTGLRPSGPGGERWGRPSDAGWWTVEPELGRVAHGIPSRVDRLRCLGNAVVPQVAEFVGRQLAAHIDGAVS